MNASTPSSKPKPLMRDGRPVEVHPQLAEAFAKAARIFDQGRSLASLTWPEQATLMGAWIEFRTLCDPQSSIDQQDVIRFSDAPRTARGRHIHVFGG